MTDTDRSPQPLGAHEIRRIATVAVCAPTTVRRYLERLPVRDVCRVRIERALRRLHINVNVEGAATS